MAAKISKADLNHPMGIVSGVTEDDTKVQAAQKAIALAKSLGMSTVKMEKMLADYRNRTGE